MSTGASISCPAPAKVNLFLRVLAERSDGYHEIETIFQAVGLHDSLMVELADGARVTLEVTGADLGPAESNLAYRAARAVLDTAGSRRGLHVRLGKRIPAGAGLGGGSSDAAATLRCANSVLGEPLAEADLMNAAAALGSDVPFFLGRSTLALGTGRGERIEALPPLAEAHLVLVLPPVHVDTAWAYRTLTERRRGADEAPRSGLRGNVPRDWGEVAALAANDFEGVVASAHPKVATSLAGLRDAGASPVLMSGSGSACFGVFQDTGAAARAASSLSGRLPWPALVTHTLAAWPSPEPGDPAPGTRRP